MEVSVPIQPLDKKLDLLEEWDQIKKEEIIRHVKFLRLYGQNWDLQNLDWSLELLEGSCELNLANKVQENMIALSSELESGPTYFFYMMKEIISSTEDAVLSMIDRVKHIKYLHSMEKMCLK